jgi:hypothetical protein
LLGLAPKIAAGAEHWARAARDGPPGTPLPHCNVAHSPGGRGDVGPAGHREKPAQAVQVRRTTTFVPTAVCGRRASRCPSGLVGRFQDDAVAQAGFAAYGLVVDDGVGPQSKGLPGCKECFWLSGQQADAHDGADWASLRR